MKKADMKLKAQEFLMDHIAKCGGGEDYEDFVEAIGNAEDAEAVLMSQMDRIAKLFGYKRAWFY